MAFQNLNGLTGGLFGALLSFTLLGCGGGGSETTLPGVIAYVGTVNGAQRLFVADGSTANAAREVDLSSINVLETHDAGADNLQPTDIESFGRPKWDPSGSRFAVVAVRGAQAQLLVVDPDANLVTTASTLVQDIRFIDWSSDGRLLTYLEVRDDSAPPRVAFTTISTGDVQILTSTDERIVDTLRWDENSTGIYCSSSESIFSARRLSWIDVATKEEKILGDLPDGRFQDLWRDRTLLYASGDNEFESIGTLFPDEVSGYVAASGPGDGLYTGWFSSGSRDLISVEQVVISEGEVFTRQRPFLAKLDPSSPARQPEYIHIPVSAPLPLKWDFFER